MTEKCALCQKDLNPYDVGVAREVRGWVSGPKKDHMRLRVYTGRNAHDTCVTKLLNGQAIDQPSLLEEPPHPATPEGTGEELGW